MARRRYGALTPTLPRRGREPNGDHVFLLRGRSAETTSFSSLLLRGRSAETTSFSSLPLRGRVGVRARHPCQPSPKGNPLSDAPLERGGRRTIGAHVARWSAVSGSADAAFGMTKRRGGRRRSATGLYIRKSCSAFRDSLLLGPRSGAGPRLPAKVAIQASAALTKCLGRPEETPRPPAPGRVFRSRKDPTLTVFVHCFVGSVL